MDGTLKGGTLGSSKTARPTIADGATQTTTVEVPEGATSLDVAIGSPADNAADLDLMVYDAKGDLVGSDADADAEESVSVADPAAGTYTIEVLAYDVPSGSTAFDYRDVFFSTALGSVTPDGSGSVRLGTGAATTVSAHVTATATVPEGRDLFGEVHLVNDRGTAVGEGTVTIGKVTQ